MRKSGRQTVAAICASPFYTSISVNIPVSKVHELPSSMSLFYDSLGFYFKTMKIYLACRNLGGYSLGEARRF
jgi:hypothetical protein